MSSESSTVATPANGARSHRLEGTSLSYKLALIWPVLPPVAIAIVGFWLMQKFLVPDLPIAVPKWEPAKVVGAETTQRMMVASTLLLLITAAAAAVAVAAMVIRRNLKGGYLAIAYAVASAIAITIGWFAYNGCVAFKGDNCKHLYVYLGDNFFAQTIGAFPRPGTGLALLDWIIDAGNAAAIAAAAFVAAAVAALIPSAAPNLDPADPAGSRDAMDKAAAELANQVRDLKYLLFAAAIVLFTGVIQMKAWRDWPLAFLGDDKAYVAVATASVNFQAFHFVLILAAIFLPTALRLRFAVDALSKRDLAVANDPAARARWIDAHGVSLSMGEQAQRIFALITPFLAGPAVELIKKIADFVPL